MFFNVVIYRQKEGNNTKTKKEGKKMTGLERLIIKEQILHNRAMAEKTTCPAIARQWTEWADRLEAELKEKDASK